MSIIDNIDIFKNILSYMYNYHSIYILNKYYHSLLPKHKIINYRDLYSCSMYNYTNKYEAITLLKKFNHKNSIHFRNRKQFKIAKKHLYKKGCHNHYCCNGTGIIYMNTDFFTNRII
jgi:hypothetical protein